MNNVLDILRVTLIALLLTFAAAVVIAPSPAAAAVLIAVVAALFADLAWLNRPPRAAAPASKDDLAKMQQQLNDIGETVSALSVSIGFKPPKRSGG